MTTQNITSDWKASINPWITMIPIMITVFMFALDETISNVALPYMAGSFSVSHNESTWIITSYLVASGVVIPAVDFFSKLMGRKNYYLFSVVIFTIASINLIPFLVGFVGWEWVFAFLAIGPLFGTLAMIYYRKYEWSHAS